jgi:hypothetical protein
MLPKDVVQLMLARVPRMHIYRRVCQSWNRWLSEEEFIKKWEKRYVFDISRGCERIPPKTKCFLSDPQQAFLVTVCYNGIDFYERPESRILEVNTYSRGKKIECARRFYSWIYNCPRFGMRYVILVEDGGLMMYSQIEREGYQFKHYHKVCRLEKIRARLDDCPWKSRIDLDQINRDPDLQPMLPESVNEIPGMQIATKFVFVKSSVK